MKRIKFGELKEGEKFYRRGTVLIKVTQESNKYNAVEFNDSSKCHYFLSECRVSSLYHVVGSTVQYNICIDEMSVTDAINAIAELFKLSIDEVGNLYEQYCKQVSQ